MADFNVEFHNLKPLFSEMNNSNMDLLNNLSSFENLNSHVQGLVSLSSNHDSFLDHHHHQLSQLPMTFTDTNIQSSVHSDSPFYDPLTHFLPSTEGPSLEDNSLKGTSETDNKKKRNYSSGGKKRKRGNEREVEKPREVIHVRAKRGQATDSHSLAERLRREKINEKLRSLQDLVPGCYKTMGMAVMLDVIIKYVQSLQNQIEFLSMKLSAASLFYDFNSEMEPMETMQVTNGFEAQGMERTVGEGYGGGFSHFPPPSAWPL
ncbi:hypothetical protein CsSME_00037290 [Camellia sinensis var. sinensis]|uniref:transcription factor bHLH75-like n=1 Tax=Camellia sinensis TaxID=4442 RepID=UPI001036A2EB|nr:transcription factor bHLH75-like [Camellia sinensis]